MAATYDDAKLVVQLMRWGTELGLEDALRTIFAEVFDPDIAKEEDPAVGKVLLYGETLGTLVKHDVLDRDLICDLWWMAGIWARVQPAVARTRELDGEPKLYENFEALAV
jgi:hypothetical protein